MTSWLEPLGRDRARRARAGATGPSSEQGLDACGGRVAKEGHRRFARSTESTAGWLAGMVPADERGMAVGNSPDRVVASNGGADGVVAAGGAVVASGSADGIGAAGGAGQGRMTAGRPLEPAGGLWPVGGPRRAQWSPVGPGLARLRRPPGFRAIFAAMNASIVRLDAPLEPDVSTPDADRLLVGVPEHRVWNYFTDSTQTFFAGRWAGTRGKWRVRYTENELCVMTAGRVVITPDSGESREFGPGAAFVIPAGFTGTWEVLEDCAKVYAIFEPRT